MTELTAKDRIIVALDVNSLREVEKLAWDLRDHVGYFKVGLKLLTNFGAREVIPLIYSAGGKVFLDGKFHDIPNTIAGAVEAATNLGVEMMNLHCLSGRKAMEAAVIARDEASLKHPHRDINPLLLGVTLLTSLGYDDLVEMGIEEELNITDKEELERIKQNRIERLVVRHLAHLAQESGLDGVIASPQEIRAIRGYCESELLVVTPGIRPGWAQPNDQKRFATPRDAIRDGANYIVVGRPITSPPPEIGTPVDAAKLIITEIKEAPTIQ